MNIELQDKLSARLETLRVLLADMMFSDYSIALLNKAHEKAQSEPIYAEQLAHLLDNPSSIETRELLSHWGRWLGEAPQPLTLHAPVYPHREAVNKIDAAIYKAHREHGTHV